jgi:hypothetical protein
MAVKRTNDLYVLIQLSIRLLKKLANLAIKPGKTDHSPEAQVTFRSSAPARLKNFSLAGASKRFRETLILYITKVESAEFSKDSG